MKSRFKSFKVWAGSMLIAGYCWLLRTTQRVEFTNDRREEIRQAGGQYIYSFLHAHQLSMTVAAEDGSGAMVSRSADGELIVPALKMVGCVPIRGSKWRPGDSKGGRKAVEALTDHVIAGNAAAIAVDGPRGPRGRAHKGVAAVAIGSGAAVINVVAVCSCRIVLKRTWDRMEIPLPFGRVQGFFSDPIYPRDGEKVEAFRRRVEDSLRELEATHCEQPTTEIDATEKRLGSKFERRQRAA